MARLPRYPTNPVGLNRDADAALDALLAYVATFFHGAPRHQNGGSSALQSNGRLKRALAPSRQAAMRSPAWQTTSRYSTSTQRRTFHNYFVTHLPSSSVHPDSRIKPGTHHKLPRSASTPHTPTPESSPAVRPPNMPMRDLTVVRIPLRSAKHHFGAYNSRGSRSYNEDTNQAGTIDMPAFAKRAPMSLVRSAMSDSKNLGEGINADSSKGDPQIFYFAVFDGHGGVECSNFLRDELHGYIEQAASDFELQSSLRRDSEQKGHEADGDRRPVNSEASGAGSGSKDGSTQDVKMKSGQEVMAEMELPDQNEGGVSEEVARMESIKSDKPVHVNANLPRALQLQRELIKQYKDTVGGYFRRFKPAHFHLGENSFNETQVSAETILNYAFLRADLDFITAQARKPDPDDPYVADFPLNQDEVLGSPHLPPSGQGIGGPARFKGGSTASIALISTPTPAPFWHPSARSTLLVAHVGDTRILLCETATGLARPLTSDHHPSSPTESRRLRRFAESLITDSFGEERISGLANSRAFGDMQSKRIGVSAEPETTRTELGPAEYSFLVLMSDGVSGTLSDQEIVDVIKEARTPEQGAKDVVDYATEISSDGDNATCLVVRLGGWERRSEGGLGSLGTKEIRDARRAEALDPRRGRR